MRLPTLLFITLTILALMGCAPQPTAPAAPTVIPFPTMTPGSQIQGFLPTAPPATQTYLSNPATAIAAANMPTATPNYGECPNGGGNPSFSTILASGLSVQNSITTFLNDGGTIAQLEAEMLASDRIDDNLTITNSYDLTGEGTPEIFIAVNIPPDGGTLLALTCENGRYTIRYQTSYGGNVPQILRVGDMNFDQQPEVLFASEVCSEIDGLCQYQPGVITWDRQRGTFQNLMNASPDGDIAPTFGDLDNDNVIEIITRQAGRGNTQTGPLRTGTQIYDWNGVTYVLSLSQPDPLRYVIQAIWEGDRAFRERRMDDAARLFLFALESDTLGYWFGGDEEDILRSYILYRLMLTFAFAENGDPLNAFQETLNAFPEFDRAPIYARLTEIFWNTYQQSNNLNTACVQVLAAAEQRPEVLNLLNRYGTRNPTYTLQNLCPF